MACSRVSAYLEEYVVAANLVPLPMSAQLVPAAADCRDSFASEEVLGVSRHLLLSVAVETISVLSVQLLHRLFAAAAIHPQARDE